jgi:hypothetical protein
VKVYSERLPLKYLVSDHGICLGIDTVRCSYLFLVSRAGVILQRRPVGDRVVENLDYHIPAIVEALAAPAEGRVFAVGRSGESGPTGEVDVLVATYESGQTLERALVSVRRMVPVRRLIVVDRSSRDSTREIAARFGAEIYDDPIGLGYARNLALAKAETDWVLFLDGDVEIVRRDFFARARGEAQRSGTGAVVGASVGHPFQYGLPLGLTLIDRRLAMRAEIPDRVQGRETYFLQRRLRRERRKVRYVPDAMRHFGTFRSAPGWPEFQGASIRLAAGWDPREVAYAGLVVGLMHANSGCARHVLYTPIFFLRLLRGYLAPRRWGRLARTPG